MPRAELRRRWSYWTSCAHTHAFARSASFSAAWPSYMVDKLILRQPWYFLGDTVVVRCGLLGAAVAPVAYCWGSPFIASIVVDDLAETRAGLPGVCCPTVNMPRKVGQLPNWIEISPNKRLSKLFILFVQYLFLKYREIGLFHDVACLHQ